MADYFEIDFLDIETKKSGDAITIRYSVAGETFIHVVDAGFQSSGDGVESHIRQHYDAPSFIDHVVASHAQACPSMASGVEADLAPCP